MLQDLRFTLRLIAKERWFSAAAIVALALGIGVNAMGFTLMNASGLRAGHRHCRAAYSNATMNISDDRALPEQARGARLTANTFGVLGEQPILGRDFAPDDERKGAEAVVIISQNIWKNRYGADPNVLGRTLRLNGQPATIIAVMPDSMKFPDNTDVEAVAVTTSVPPFVAGQRSVEIDGRPARTPDEPSLNVSTVTISPRFFDVVRLAVGRGRSFHETDGAPGSETVIINERMAAQFFPRENPIGSRLRFVQREPTPGQPAPASPEQRRGVCRTIVGISPTIRHGSHQDGEPNAVVYIPSLSV